MHFRLQIPSAIYEAMIAHAQAELPNECVGFLAGTAEGVVTEHLPLVNRLADPRRFESEGRSQLAAEKRCRDLGLRILAVYHSHPTSPPIPSRTDIDPEENLWVGQPVASIIISLAAPEPEVRAWWLEPHRYRPADWTVMPQEGTGAEGTSHQGDGPQDMRNL
jgi:proteasome lid subunit RPN8/RPN11